MLGHCVYREFSGVSRVLCADRGEVWAGIELREGKEEQATKGILGTVRRNPRTGIPYVTPRGAMRHTAPAYITHKRVTKKNLDSAWAVPCKITARNTGEPPMMGAGSQNAARHSRLVYCKAGVKRLGSLPALPAPCDVGWASTFKLGG